MKYTAQFRDINNKLYSIEMVTNNDVTVTKEVKLGKAPFITEMENGDDIFKPIKYQAATIQLFTDRVLFDLYSSIAKGTKITLFDSNHMVKWVGYIQPNLYNQDYNWDNEYLDIDAIDGLSILQYLDYESKDKNFISFTQLINDILSKCDCYTHFYLPSSIQEKEGKNENIFDFLSIAKANFFDEEGKGWKCNEILEEMCRYMGVTAVAENDTVFFIDYEGLQQGNVSYWKIPINDITKGYEVIVKDNNQITASSYSASKTQISLGETYNKIKVIDSLNSVDDLMPSLEDKKKLKNKNIDDWMEYRKIPYVPNKVYFDAYYKFYSHPNFISLYHQRTEYGAWTNEPNAIVKKYDDMDKYAGGNIIKCFIKKEEKDDKLIPHLDYQTYIYISCKDYIFDSKITPAITINMDNEIALNAKDAYLILNGSAIFSSKGFHAPITGEEISGDDFKKENLYIEAVLRYGNKYYSNANTDNMYGGEWVDNETTFKIMLDCNDDETSHLFNKSWDIKSNISYTMGLESSTGYAIKLPFDMVVGEMPKLTFVQPMHRVTNKTNMDKIPLTGIWINGFEMKVEIAYNISEDKDKEDTDTSYENVIDEDYVNDFDEVEFKICTFDDKKANYSAVIYNNVNEIKYLDKIFNKATRDYSRCEENFIKRYIRQYSTPPLILDISLHNKYSCYSLLYSNLFGQRKTYFIIDRMRIDWKNNISEMKLNEIKQ